MKNEAHVIGDRVPNERDLMVELKLVSSEPTAPRRFALARRIFGLLAKTLQERNNRLALLELNEEQLKDIGVSRCEAYGGYARYRRSEAVDSQEPGGPEEL